MNALGAFGWLYDIVRVVGFGDELPMESISSQLWEPCYQHNHDSPASIMAEVSPTAIHASSSSEIHT
ncbi:hypothetical protein Pyn_08960 [Prunus yedoensis var. nudiflora]|uniref:Uncharacterized protein n=1 Tax=Prunus yedoensis var. nudiflora TaxID=2094558 RepID=A0A314YLS4_PRUYE|nr:hypothetical protein Pyn_08960 [Prunus yedoensis var. nudiflora]